MIKNFGNFSQPNLRQKNGYTHTCIHDVERMNNSTNRLVRFLITKNTLAYFNTCICKFSYFRIGYQYGST
jgi:hypothetical protein